MMIGTSSRFGERDMRKVLPPAGLLTLGFVALIVWRGLTAQAGPDPQEKGPPAAPEFAKDTEWV
jgi:hypothetical protein